MYLNFYDLCSALASGYFWHSVWIRDLGFSCSTRSNPNYLCDLSRRPLSAISHRPLRSAHRWMNFVLLVSWTRTAVVQRRVFVVVGSLCWTDLSTVIRSERRLSFPLSTSKRFCPQIPDSGLYVGLLGTLSPQNKWSPSARLAYSHTHRTLTCGPCMWWPAEVWRHLKPLPITFHWSWLLHTCV